MMKKLSFTRKDLELFALNSLGFHKAALRRMSTLFLGQLFQMQLAGDSTLHKMAREVKWLERDQDVTAYADHWGGDLFSASNQWVVYKRHNGTNYYLTLARLNDGDQYIHQQVRQAYDFDFPYLRGNA